MKNILLLLLGCIAFTSFAQIKDNPKKDSTKTPTIVTPPSSTNQAFPFLNVVSPSPEAASLGRYGEIPVSLSTGTSSYEVPIYNIVSGSLKVPVKVSFHGAGVKVNDIASSVGTGATLVAGGAITRTLRGGIWDECSYGYLNQIIPEQSDIANFRCFLGNLNTNIEYVDGMPDDFYYNFNEVSGKFLFHNRNLANQNITPIPITYPHSNLKIEWINFQNFKITDADGTVYKFEDLENTVLVQTGRTNPCGSTYTSAWYLTQIISANKIDVITFTYTPWVRITGSRTWSTTLSKEVNSFGAKTFTYAYANQRSDVNSIMLSEINYKNGKVAFTYANDRQDQGDADAKRLTTITVYAKDASNNLQELKHFSLNHTYFECADGRSQVDQPTSNVTGHTGSFLLKRLRLDSIVEYGSDGTALNPHTFNYWEDQPLAIYGAMAQDYWGYSNNATANKNLLLWDTDVLRTEEPSSLYGANCNPNFNYAVSGALKRITYPTKGYTDFFYEANTIIEGGSPINGGGIRIKKTVSHDNNNNAIQTSYNYTNSYFTNAIFTGTFDSNVYNFTTEVKAEDNGNGNPFCTSHFITVYPEKVNVSLGSEATFVANEEVEEYKEDGLGNRLGKKKYTFSTSVDPSYADFPIETVSASWKRGQLLNEKTYSILPSNSEVLIKEALTAYTELTQPYKTRGYITRLDFDNDYYEGFCEIAGNYYCDKYSEHNQYVFVEKNEQSSVFLPTQTITTIYDQNGQNPVQNTVTYEFSPLTLQLIRETDQRSDGISLETINKYPNDFGGNTVYDEMVNRHILSPTIETEQKENNVSLKKVKTNYKQWYSSTVFDGVNGFFAPLSVETQEFGGVWETEVMMGEVLVNPTQDGYDVRSRPIIYTERSGLTTQLDWWNDTGKKDLVKKRTVNNQFINYDYEPSVGLMSILDQNNLGSNFTYDVFKRLKLVKDQDLNITDKYNYFYASSTTTCVTPSPPTVSISNTTLCDITLSASGCTGTVNWSNGSANNSITVSSKTTLNYTATCTDGACVSAASNSVVAPALPSGWTAAEIGTPPVAGCVNENSGIWTIKSSGNTFNASDNFNYVYKNVTGNAVIVAKINSMSANSEGMRSGIMLRANSSPTADYYQFFFDSGYQVLSLYEQNSSTGTGDNQLGYQATTIPSWIRLKKDGNNISVWYTQNTSPAWNNDSDWTLYTTVSSSAFNSGFLMGIHAYNNAHNINSLMNQTEFSNVSINNF